MTRLARIGWPLCLALAAPPAPAQSTEILSLRDELWRTDGPVRTIVATNNTLYLGGRFSYVGPLTGGGGKLAAPSANSDLRFPRIDGSLLAAAPDGAGGWFIGGVFTNVGGLPRRNLARILPDNTVDPNWTPNPNSGITAMARTGSTLYVGGAFTEIAGQPRSGIAALTDAGAAAAWNPGANGVVRAIVPAGSTVYVGGSFTSIGGQTRNRLAALDHATGLATAWNPDADGPGAAVTTIALTDNTAYVGGTFASIGGKPRERIAAVELATGLATSWNAHANGTVNAIAVAGSAIYVGGQFTSIGSENRNRLAALDAATARALDWNPNPDGDIAALALVGGTLYAGGGFQSIGGVSRSLLAGLDVATGRAGSFRQSFSAFATGTTPSVLALAWADGSLVVGGTFASIGGLLRNNLAALNAATGAATDWNPNAQAQVNALAYYNGLVYAGGSFTALNGQPRNFIGAVHPVSAALTPWNPNALGSPIGAVLAMAFSDTRIFLAGSFSNIGGRSRNGLAAVDLGSGDLDAWNPSPTLSSLLAPTITTIQIADRIAYIGGNFDGIGGQSRTRIAGISIDTGAVVPWNPAPNDLVATLNFDGPTLYAGGTFTSIGGQTRNRIATLDPLEGTIRSWNPDAGGTAVVVLTVLPAAGTIFVGGQFANIGGEFRTNLAGLDSATEHATDWKPNPNGPVRALAMSSGDLFVGGDFTSIDSKPVSFIAGFARRAAFDPASPAFSATEGFSFSLLAPAGQTLAIQSSPDLVNWSLVRTLTLSASPLAVTLPLETNAAARFYRTVLQPAP